MHLTWSSAIPSPLRRERIVAIGVPLGDPAIAVLDLVLGLALDRHLPPLRLSGSLGRLDVRGALVALDLVLPATAGVRAGDNCGLLGHLFLSSVASYSTAVAGV